MKKTAATNTDQSLEAFANQLVNINVEATQMQPYCKRYLQHVIDNALYYCNIYKQILHTVLQHTSIDKQEICLVDYGAGNGVMGMCAKYMGFKKVIIVDVNDAFVLAAKELSELMGIEIDECITGDLVTQPELFHNINPNAIISFDVIEHIYDLNIFFNNLQQLNPSIVSVFGTGVNAHNPIKNNYFKKLQIKDELKGGEPTDFILYGATATPPFIKIRENIIATYAPNLPAEKITLLSKYTRGMHQKDIANAVKNFIENHQLPTLITHPTNTCDPLTGSFTERLLTKSEYATIYNHAGFSVQFINGFYNQYNPTFKSKLMVMANWLVKIVGIKIAPYILLVGKSRN
jgi:2-polyprenyl-3-methyl-5-hydroxy-6-metoxy-1,4-benzoquinol methylase